MTSVEFMKMYARLITVDDSIIFSFFLQGQVIPYDKRKGNWLISKFTKFDKE